ncbi:hypothetical protein HYDPIDRAFT_115504 [Hydnomerulius pinastri MD-312]|uniref:DUF6534 domain-containing protein n=1 Tax=Hydnomerulius pinastri MD-312 TaxID=994086 RepID=A0A0C9VUL1_9AGAM|nr:hypothetical protein HYDPIDRAFT_115504 [Hydnomerulius pinastri MD-312]
MDDYLIVHYADDSALQSANWPSTSTYIIGFVIDFFVYLYFTWRIWSFTENMYIVIFMSSISISRTVVSIIACVLSVLSDTWSSYLKHTRPLILTGNVLFIIGDTLSASVMAYHLNKSKRQSGMYRTDLLINRLLIFAVATGGLTSLVDIIALVFTLTQPQSLAFMGPILVQTRLYANSLLTSLNIRNANARAYNAATDPQSGIDIELQFARPPDISATSQASGRQSAIGIRKSTAESWHTAQDSGTSSQPYF